ncbi:MAG: glycosyltransferase [candidate division Zixibacteria bacterium]|nr:glycosyltransferase [candidate division Zixibacteria bacterium]
MSSQQRKRTILVITHLYPRFEGCTMAPFLGIWAENLAKQYNMIILVPRHEKALPERNGVKLVYFGYFFKSLEKFSYTSSLFAKVRKFNILYQLLAIFYFISYTYKCLIIARDMKPDIIHSHWFVPAGLVGHITSVFTGIPHVVSVYSDGFLIKTNPILRLVARIIFNRAKSVIAISKSIKEYVDLIYPDAEVVYPCNRLF